MSKLSLLHVVENLDRGAVENWLVQVFLETRKTRPDWKWTFFCVLNKPGRLDDTVRSAGGTILYADAGLSQKLDFLRHFRRVVSEGAYDLIHMHHDFMNGFYLTGLIGLRKPRIILHVHNNDEIIPVGSHLLQRFLRPLFRSICLRYAHDIVGISKYTLSHFVQGEVKKNQRLHVLYYGITMDRFAEPVDSTAEKAAIHLPDDSKVILFIGRMNKEKNPLFVLQVLKALREERDDVYGVFVGKGELESELQSSAEKMNLLPFVRIIGWSDRIIPLMKSASVFLFPRLPEPKEGLGLVVVESQCAGLQMLTTDGIVDDAIVVPSLVKRLGLKVDQWVEETGVCLDNALSIDQETALKTMRKSAFELGIAARNLLALYEGKSEYLLNG